MTAARSEAHWAGIPLHIMATKIRLARSAVDQG